MAQRIRTKIWLSILIIGILSNCTIQITKAADISDRVDTDMKYKIVDGDWLGLTVTDHEYIPDGTKNITKIERIAIGVTQVISRTNSFSVTFNAYNESVPLSPFPKQGGAINLNNWNSLDRITYRFNNTVQGLFSPFIIPYNTGADQIYIDLTNMSQYINVFPFDMDSPLEIITPRISEIIWQDVSSSVNTTDSTVKFFIKYQYNCTDISDVIKIWHFEFTESVNITYNPKHHVFETFSKDVQFSMIRYTDDTYTSINFPLYINGGGVLYNLIYDSNAHRGVWFYENWKWFIPLLLLSASGIYIIIWWKMSINKCKSGAENVFCKKPKVKEQKTQKRGDNCTPCPVCPTARGH